MPFLCGSIRLRTKKKTDDDESLLPRDWLASPAAVRIPNDPVSQMTVQQDFISSLRDELTISVGETVRILDIDRKWAFVRVAGPDDRSGFVPLSCLGPVKDERSTLTQIQIHTVDTPQSVSSPNLPDNDCTSTGMELCVETNGSRHSTENTNSISSNVASVFTKAQLGHYVVLYDFTAQNENDISAVCGEDVVSLNEEDPDWTWVQKTADRTEGFLPRAFLYAEGNNDPAIIGRDDDVTQRKELSKEQIHDKMRQCGTELMSLYDYQGRLDEDLTVQRGDLLYADMTNQPHNEWLWAYCPVTSICGFIPREYVRPPVLE